MKGDARVLEWLNTVLKNELTAINQYFLHARMYRNWGLSKLGEHEYEESIDEMKHADRIVERILFLEGLPNLQDLSRLRVGENTVEILKADLALEHDAIPALRDAIAYCEGAGDYVTRELFEDILSGEEDHVDWLETQLDLVVRLGLENYEQANL